MNQLKKSKILSVLFCVIGAAALAVGMCFGAAVLILGEVIPEELEKTISGVICGISLFVSAGLIFRRAGEDRTLLVILSAAGFALLLWIGKSLIYPDYPGNGIPNLIAVGISCLAAVIAPNLFHGRKRSYRRMSAKRKYNLPKSRPARA